MRKENNKMQVDIDTLKKQNVNDLLSIKEIYKRIEELGEKITQVKYIDNTIVKKIKKEYENLNKIILDENIQVQLDNKIDEFNLNLTHDIETINSHNSQLTNDIETINSQLDNIDNITKKRITTSQLGLDSNAINNFNKLTQAINKGYEIIVDGFYDIQPTKTFSVLEDMNLYGVNEECGFNLLGNISCFDVIKENWNLDINRVKFTSLDSTIFLFEINNNVNIDLFKVTSCSFQGNLSLIRYSPDITKDISTASIKNLEFKSNTLIDINASFVVIPNICFDKIVISNNKINNFNYVLFNITITNGHADEINLLKNRKFLEVIDNYVECDVDWWGSSGSGLYYCFVLCECNTLEYKRNTVIGMKTEENTSLYDVYGSCEYVYSENNLWKNNIVFNSAKLNNVLMKAKQNSGIKSFKNNKYIVEKSFASDLNKSTSLLTVKLFDIQDEPEKWIIDNNTIDVYDLKLQAGSRFIKNFIFTNNIIKTNIASDNIMYLRCNSDTDYSNSIYNISYNQIYIKDNGSNFGLITGVDYSNGTNNLGNIIVENNILNCADIKVCLVNTILCDRLIIRNNEITLNGAVSRSIEYDTTANYKIISNNNIYSKNSSFRFVRTNIYGNTYFYNNRFVVINHTADGNCNLMLMKNTKLYPETPLYYKCRIDVLKGGSISSSDFVFKVYGSGTDNYVVFTNSKGNELTSKIASSEDNSFDNNGSILKVNGDDLSIKFVNVAASTYITLDSNLSSCEIRCSIDTFEN